uniref:Ribonuclease P/MRP subunit p14 n=1 Tax=Taeniopygia guttata TaxID=59729 RepID=H0ZFS4_TAEGU
MPIFIEQVQDTKMVLSSQLVQTQAARLVLCTSPGRFSCVSLQNGGWAAESLRCLYLVPGATFTGSCLGTDTRAWRTSAGAFLCAGPLRRSVCASGQRWLSPPLPGDSSQTLLSLCSVHGAFGPGARCSGPGSGSGRRAVAMVILTPRGRRRRGGRAARAARRGGEWRRPRSSGACCGARPSITICACACERHPRTGTPNRDPPAPPDPSSLLLTLCSPSRRELPDGGARPNAAQFKQLVVTALRELHGEVGAALPVDVLTYEEKSLSAILRVISSGLVKLWSALTLLGFYQNRRCAFRVLQTSPFLLALSGNSRELALD